MVNLDNIRFILNIAIMIAVTSFTLMYKSHRKLTINVNRIFDVNVEEKRKKIVIEDAQDLNHKDFLVWHQHCSIIIFKLFLCKYRLRWKDMKFVLK